MGKALTHSRWIKGLQAGFDRYSQPKGSFARCSNVVLTRRGAIKTCDGTQVITSMLGNFQPPSSNFGPIVEVFLFQPTGGNAGYFGLVKNAQVPEMDFYAFVPSYAPGNIIKVLPPDALPRQGTGLPGGFGGSGSGSGGSSGFNPPTPTGGVTGQTSPIPLIVQFVNKMILALGNGITPYQSDGTTPNTIQITNSFVATYPAWAASTVFNQGDQIEVTISAVAYVFTATQGGVTGSGSAPAFSATKGSTVADNNIIWTNSGQVSSSPPPRGAAHAEVYAGSLWVANTGTVMSTDQLDGPSALGMSDLNNPLSWNPLNRAQIQPDDGDQCTGIKAFTVAAAGIAPQNFLMYFKNYSSFLIQGVFGASDFAITRLQTDMGCVAPRTLQFVPGYGIMRLSHLGFAVTDGITDKLQDPESIRPYLFPESTESDITPVDQTYIYFAKAAQTVNPPMYVCAVPLQGLATTAFSGINVVPGPYGITQGFGITTMYIIIQATAANGQVFSSGEYVIPLTQSGGPGGHTTVFAQAISFTLPTNAGVASWKIYTGGSSNGENKFYSVPGGVSTFTITATTNFSSGSPVVDQGGALARIFCYDLIVKAWTVVDLPFPISVLKQFRSPGSQPITVMAGFYDSAIRRWQAGDTQWDAGAINAGGSTQQVQWSFQDEEVYIEGGAVKLFHDQAIIRGDGSPISIGVSAQINGKMRNTIQAALTALGTQYDARVRIMRNAENLNLTISGSGPATVESVMYEVNPRPVGSALIFS